MSWNTRKPRQWQLAKTTCVGHQLFICTRASVPEVVDCFYICVVALSGKQDARFIAGFGGQTVQFPGLWKPNDGTNEFE